MAYGLQQCVPITLDINTTCGVLRRAHCFLLLYLIVLDPEPPCCRLYLGVGQGVCSGRVKGSEVGEGLNFRV